ncbi:hypothetical protein L3X38_017631 [Prunus dulcis]|uniref:Uncharacterized protein n=1 Tax=Prunus dulcis TaxID=3755 RepID=A0AAD4W7H0_PRUDU|nr:hypothetical protein L3X38_017631 [Prunus dulcis]
MGDDSKIMVSASASATKKERPSRDYSTRLLLTNCKAPIMTLGLVVRVLQLLVIVWQVGSMGRSLLRLQILLPMPNGKKIIAWCSHGFSIP